MFFRPTNSGESSSGRAWPFTYGRRAATGRRLDAPLPRYAGSTFEADFAAFARLLPRRAAVALGLATHREDAGPPPGIAGRGSWRECSPSWSARRC